jgi:alpha-mannosidase
MNPILCNHTVSGMIFMMTLVAFCMAAPSPAKKNSADPALIEVQVDNNRFFHIMPHSHIDVEWYWTVSTSKEWSKEIFDRAIRLLKENPDFRFTQDQTYLLREYYNALSAEEKEYFKQVVTEKRLALVGGMFVMPEVAEPCGEALIRQILVGQHWLQDTFGMRTECGWFIDTFGQIPQIPQILYRSGYRYNVFWRDIPLNVNFETMPANFYWQAPDGSRILTHWLPGGYDSTKTQVGINLAHQKSGHLLQPYGGDVTRPPRQFSEIKQVMTKKLALFDITNPSMDIVTGPEYMAIIDQEKNRLPVMQCDFNPPYRAADLRGCYSNRIELKKRNRAAEASLFNAEVLATLAWQQGKPYPKEQFSELWEKLLFTHFHDIIGGSHHDRVYQSAMDRLLAVLEGTEKLVQESCAPDLSAQSTNRIAIMNSLSFQRSELVSMRVSKTSLPDQQEIELRTSSGEVLPCRVTPIQDSPAEAKLEWVVRDMPAMSTLQYQIALSAKAVSAAHQLPTDRIENEYYTVIVDTLTGDLVSLFDKKLRKELMQDRGNEVVAEQEKNPDLEGVMYLTGAEWRSRNYRTTDCHMLRDALGSHFVCRSTFKDCSIERTISLLDHMARVDFHTRIVDFTSGDLFFKVSFPLKMDSTKIHRTYETAFAATPCQEGYVGAQTWIDFSDDRFGVALINHGTPGYWLQGERLELVLLRTFSNYTHYQRSGLKRKVPGYESSTQTELAREHGTHEFDYCLVSHSGPWQNGNLMAMGQSYNIPVVSIAGKTWPQTGLVSFTGNFIMTAMKQSYDGKSIVVRGFETRGKRHKVHMNLSSSIKEVCKTNLLEEQPEKLAIKNRRVEFECAPFEIVTFSLQ